MATGAVKRFSDDRGFHPSAFGGDGHHALPDGTKVSYDAETGDKGHRAVNTQVA